MTGIPSSRLAVSAIAYAAIVGTVCIVLLFAQRPSTRVLTVERINVVESDGTLRMVISNRDRLPGVMDMQRKEDKSQRPQAGLIFYNDEGQENGGLIFGGRKNERGEVVDAGGSLSFDRYDANQVVQLIGVDDKSDRFAGLMVFDSHSGTDTRRRVWVGRDDSGVASLALMDAQGKKRLLLQVSEAGEPQIQFLDANGKPLRSISARP
jgi:hypothetical protein